ncbi:hypothetical protein J6590_040426, partial [Homalodisca vitripennis]
KTNFEDEDRNGRPSTSRTDVNLTRVRELVRSDRILSVKIIAEELNNVRLFSDSRVKTAVKVQHFQTTQDVQNSVTRVLEDITEHEFQICYHQ